MKQRALQQELRRAGEQRAELVRRLQRAEREVADAAALAGTLQSRADELRAAHCDDRLRRQPS